MIRKYFGIVYVNVDISDIINNIYIIINLLYILLIYYKNTLKKKKK